MEVTRQPYEFLARWDQNGKLIGAHVQHRLIMRDGVKVVGETVGNAEPVGLDGVSGFPLADILSTVQISAVEAASAANVKVAELEAELATRRYYPL